MKKLDEMDKKIRLQAHSLTFRITLLLLSLWTIYEHYIAFVEKQSANSVPGYFLIFALVFEGVYELILKHRMVEGDEEYKEPNKALLIILATIVVVALIISIGSILLLK